MTDELNKPRPFNPFNVLLLAAGILFVITTCAYAVLVVKSARPFDAQETTAASVWLLELVDKHGFTALMVELAVLAFSAFAAMATDDYWARRAAAKRGETRAEVTERSE